MSFVNGVYRLFDRDAAELSEIMKRPAYIAIPPLIGYGIPTVPLRVENIPHGCVVARIRCRPDKFIIVYLKNGKTFEGWHCDFTDETHTAVKLISKIGVNQRP